MKKKRVENEGRGSRDDVRRLEGGDAASLSWLKSREEISTLTSVMKIVKKLSGEKRRK